MARGTTLTRLLDLYRAECRLSANPAHNSADRDRQINHIQRTQEWLWDDFDWPLLRVERTIVLQDGQRYYDLPDDLAIDRISKIELFYDSSYVPLPCGLDANHYTAYNSDLDERQDPAQRWRISEDEQLEIWPIPSTDGDETTLNSTLKITGIRNLNPLVASDDRADLDDRLIILFCAAEYLAANGAKDAQLKMEQANKRLLKLRGQQMPRNRFRMFGVGQGKYRTRIPIAVYNSTG